MGKYLRRGIKGSKKKVHAKFLAFCCYFIVPENYRGMNYFISIVVDENFTKFCQLNYEHREREIAGARLENDAEKNGGI